MLLAAFLGPFPARVELDRLRQLHPVEGPLLGRSGERVTAFVCVPKEAEIPASAVFWHHQHAGKFALGKK